VDRPKDISVTMELKESHLGIGRALKVTITNPRGRKLQKKSKMALDPKAENGQKAKRKNGGGKVSYGVAQKTKNNGKKTDLFAGSTRQKEKKKQRGRIRGIVNSGREKKESSIGKKKQKKKAPHKTQQPPHPPTQKHKKKPAPSPFRGDKIPRDGHFNKPNKTSKRHPEVLSFGDSSFFEQLADPSSKKSLPTKIRPASKKKEHLRETEGGT